MIIKFSMDRIKNMDQIYTWTPSHLEDFGCDGTEEHYCGWDNELEKCERCGALISSDNIENGLCPSCAAYTDKE